MAAPTITKTSSATATAISSKISGTTVSLTVTSTAYAVGDYVAVWVTLDPAAGAVSFARTGTAVIGAWTAPIDVTNGSGTSGERGVYAYAKVTTAGTILTITVTHPTVTARSGLVTRVNGADGTSPILASNSAAAANVAVSTGAAGRDVTAHGVGGYELATGGASTLTISSSGSWTAGTVDTAILGTTGSGGATNISVAQASWSQLAAPNASYTFTTASSAAGVVALVYWRAPFTPPPASLTPTVISATEIDLSWAAVTGATAYTLDYSLDGATGWTNIYSGALTSFAHTGLSPTTAYFYRVSATDSAGTSTYTTANATTPISMPMTDSFTGTDGSPISASKWDTSSNAASVSLAILSNAMRGTVTGNISDSTSIGAKGSLGQTDQAVLCRARSNGDATMFLAIRLLTNNLTSGPSTTYSAEVSYGAVGATGNMTLAIKKNVSNVSTTLASDSSQPILLADTWYWHRFERLGTTLRYRKWLDGSTEPSSWDLTATDAAISTGGMTLFLWPTNTALDPRTIDLDDVTYYVPTNPVSLPIIRRPLLGLTPRWRRSR